MKRLILRLAFFASAGVFAIGSLFISGCSSSSQPQKTYYQLPVLAVSPEKSTLQEGATQAENKPVVRHERQLWVKSVNLSDFLAASGIAYQTGKVSYINASNHLWASPLQQQLQQILISELSAELPNRLISGQELEKNAETLDVTVTAFHGRYDGRVLVAGYWILSDSGRVFKQPFHVELKQEKDGYADLVLTLAKGYSQMIRSIAGQISS
ncbi:membrane integrity-associated transporter subunit PqiC [Xenorhabdus sp. 42]|uniref:membrane integrity-associated transporter subunit PqiC n=1 Tax=Xenorhabdus szentirmaii TaxID=290112 RepID=UPI0019A0652C|nr:MULTISPECIES: membrane integrity-associated transporter subunit PqiC [unclassified Xenorhabdus]MBD2782091.1 membrane integrity-associated transporter subunit PqiC [Xenorhabdus sp. 38]MBD2791474.1 membrane integrity-associated transporter subunit PqiC [Xenorhabdus sp. CUL]MBD2803892.1 membrane integrity-associated transporter subunit PqiC [Xenorhabdus sp. ZM]MBD2819508.1 membrane integrity-associated transporter subunit PqiC [Xenorhabdus sp. 42]